MHDEQERIVKTVITAILEIPEENLDNSSVLQIVSTHANGRTNTASARSNLRAALNDLGITVSNDLLDVCNKTAFQLVCGYRTWLKETNDPDVLDAYPARELFQCYEREAETIDWRERWKEAGGMFVEGRMIALGTDSIWSRISFFRLPFPPFDLDSGMDLNVVSRSEAEGLGLLMPNEQVVPTTVDLDFGQALKERFRFLHCQE